MLHDVAVSRASRKQPRAPCSRACRFLRDLFEQGRLFCLLVIRMCVSLRRNALYCPPREVPSTPPEVGTTPLHKSCLSQRAILPGKSLARAQGRACHFSEFKKTSQKLSELHPIVLPPACQDLAAMSLVGTVGPGPSM